MIQEQDNENEDRSESEDTDSREKSSNDDGREHHTESKSRANSNERNDARRESHQGQRTDRGRSQRGNGQGRNHSRRDNTRDNTPQRATHYKGPRSHYGRKDYSAFLDGIGVPKPTEFKPDAFQLRAIDSIAQGNDTLVVAPTGTGKTYIAVQSIAHVVSKGNRAVYTAPLKALSNTKYVELKKKFEPDFTVGLLTGDRKIDGDADIVVATTEIYRNELYNYGDNYSLVVLDEFHYLSDAQRGPVWEESIILSPKNSSLLMLSASVSNAEEIAEWIEEVRGKKVQIIQEFHRPVELRLGFMHPGLGVMPLENESGELLSEVIDFYTPRADTDYRYSKSNRKGHSRGRGRRS